jgi:hypothetical protein
MANKVRKGNETINKEMQKPLEKWEKKQEIVRQRHEEALMKTINKQVKESMNNYKEEMEMAARTSNCQSGNFGCTNHPKFIQYTEHHIKYHHNK